MTQRLDSGSISEDDYMKAIHKNNGQQTPPELIEPKQALFSSITGAYAVTSFVRSYFLRRVFEKYGIDDNFIRLAKRGIVKLWDYSK